MRVAVLADIHGNRSAFGAVLAALEADIERVLFVGDLCGYYPFVNECAELLEGRRFTGVRGNHDEVLLACLRECREPPPQYRERYGSALERSLRALTPRARGLLASLPEQHVEQLAGLRVAMYHGAPWDPLEGRVYPDFREWSRFDEVDADVILLGHTHYPLVQRRGNRLIVNPGSVGQARDRGGEACYAVLDFASREAALCRVPFDPTELVADAARNDPQLPYLANVLERR